MTRALPTQARICGAGLGFGVGLGVVEGLGDGDVGAGGDGVGRVWSLMARGLPGERIVSVKGCGPVGGGAPGLGAGVGLGVLITIEPPGTLLPTTMPPSLMSTGSKEMDCPSTIRVQSDSVARYYCSEN